MIAKFIRIGGTFLIALGGFFFFNFLLGFWELGSWEIPILAGGTGGTGLMGFFLVPYLGKEVSRWARLTEVYFQRTPTQDLVSGAVGLIVGLIIALLFSFSFARLPVVGPYLPLATTLIFGYLGWSTGVKKREELLGFLTSFSRRGSKEKTADFTPSIGYKILDTSVIIDGRIADICKTGFVKGPVLIPGFVLQELQHIADSSDVLKRNRGRRGLDILNRMRREPGLTVEVWEEDFENGGEVDQKLVRLAQELNAEIITNDFNLNKVAELQGVKVLNINELANALKPVVLPGEEMVVQLIRDGKETGQGVGYLDDGTMIVVENGKKFVGQTVTVLVTSVLQTAAGRMIFARLKSAEKKHMRSLERGEYQCL